MAEQAAAGTRSQPCSYQQQPQQSCIAEHKPSSTTASEVEVCNQYQPLDETQNGSAEQPEVSKKVLDVFADITRSLHDLLREFESLRHRLRTDRSLQSATLGVRLQSKLSTSLTDLQRMADLLQNKIAPMQELVSDMKRPKQESQLQLSALDMLKVLQLLAELRGMCHEFALKLTQLRTLTTEVLEVTRRRFRRYTKTITIDCSSIVVMILFLGFVWASKAFEEWHTEYIADYMK